MQEKLDQIINAYQSGKLKTNDFRSQIAMFINEYSNMVVQQSVHAKKVDFIEDAYKRICLTKPIQNFREAYHEAVDMWEGLIKEYREEAEAIQKMRAELNKAEPTPPDITPQGNNEPIEPSKVIKMKTKKK